MKNENYSYSLLLLALIFSVNLTYCEDKQFNKAKSSDVKTVIILGNSIVKHSPKPEIGWYGDLGMAASVKDSDFVHLLIHDIHLKDSSVKVKFRNIADFEKNFDTYQLSNFDSLKNPDILIMKISENVNNKKAMEDNFISYYDKLVKYIAPGNNSNKIIVDGFWEKADVNRLLKEYANKNNYPFVTVSDLSKDITNTAIGKFENNGVANHPSDKGMRRIEQRIWFSVKNYFEN